MAELSWPNASNSVTRGQYETIGRVWSGDGLICALSDPQMVYGDSTGMQVKVLANRSGMVGGVGWSSGATVLTKAIAANSSGSTRIDLVVLRLTRGSVYTVSVEVVTGTPGSGTPLATQTAGTTGNWEVPLAKVTVISGATTINAADVVDVSPVLNPGGLVAYRTASYRDMCLRANPGEGARCWIADVEAVSVSTGTAWTWASGTNIANADRTTNSDTTTTETEVLLLAPGTIKAGQGVTITTSPIFHYSTVAGDIVNCRIRYTTDGTTPTTTSPILLGGYTQKRLGSAGIDESETIDTFYTTAADVTLKLMITVGRASGSGSVGLICGSGKNLRLRVTAGGKWPAATGYDQ